MSIAAAILSLVIIVTVTVVLERRRASRASRQANAARIVRLRVVELSDKLAAQIFQRPLGSFGYYYLRKSEAYDGSPCWVAPPNIGDGSGYDTAERAEEYARLNAVSEP